MSAPKSDAHGNSSAMCAKNPAQCSGKKKLRKNRGKIGAITKKSAKTCLVQSSVLTAVLDLF
jgi:hypothetical protein